MHQELYTKFVNKFAWYHGAGSHSQIELAYLGLGLAGESAELQALRTDREDEHSEAYRQELLLEAGDVLWYCTRISYVFDLEWPARLLGVTDPQPAVTAGIMADLIKKIIREPDHSFQQVLKSNRGGLTTHLRLILDSVGSYLQDIGYPPSAARWANVRKLASRMVTKRVVTLEDLEEFQVAATDLETDDKWLKFAFTSGDRG